jgi:siroheme synthase
MGREAFPEAARRLIAEGRPASTPALAVENAGSPEARLISGDLATLPARLAAAECSGPVVILVGEVAARAKPDAVEALKRAASF